MGLKDFTKEEKLRTINKDIIYSTKYKKNILVLSGQFYEVIDDSTILFISHPSEKDVDDLCVDMFHEVTGCKPDDYGISVLKEQIKNNKNKNLN